MKQEFGGGQIKEEVFGTVPVSIMSSSGLTPLICLMTLNCENVMIAN